MKRLFLGFFLILFSAVLVFAQSNPQGGNGNSGNHSPESLGQQSDHSSKKQQDDSRNRNPGQRNSGLTRTAPKQIKESQNFRGTRKPEFNGIFTLNSTSASKNKNGTVDVILEFSTAVDPRSFNNVNIKINDEPLSKAISVRFNNNGTKCCLNLSEQQMPAKVDLTDILSYDGKELFPLSAYIKLESENE